MKKKLFKKLLFLVIFIACTSMYSQTVTGTISDANGPLPGANVRVKGNTSKGAVTDFDGKYSLNNIDSNTVLVFSYVGYATQEVSVGSKTTINVVLLEDASALNEVVVVGYGKTSRRLVTGAISSVKSEDLNKTPIISADQALQGQASGITVVNAGSPGTSPQVSIRGLSTFGNSTPLYVIDGIVSGGLNEVNPNDIASIDVLKDASTAAIYGSRASNGVVIITTKKGKAGDTKITFDSYVGVQNLPKKLDLLNSSEFRAFAEDTYGLPSRYTVDPESTLINTDWQDEVFDSAIMHNTNIGASGGNEQAVFNISAGYLDQKGIILNTGFKRASFRANSEFKLGDKFKIGETFSFANSTRNNEEENGDRTLVEHMIKSLPYTPVYNPDNLGGFGGTDTSLDAGSDAENPVRLQTLNSNKSLTTKALVSVYASYEIFNDLVFKTQYGMDRAVTEDEILRPAFNEGINSRGVSFISQGINTFISNTFTNSLTYSKSFNDVHNLDVLAVVESFDSTFKSNIATGSNAASNTFDLVQGASNSTNTRTEYGLISYIGRLNYNFDSKYLFSASIRRDGSSHFALGNKWGTFPALSLGWVISEEDFIQDIDAISNLKLRGSWGITGNDGERRYGFESGLVSDFVYSKLGSTGTSNLGISNPDLTWEETKMINIGLDLGLFSNSVTLALEYFNNDVEGLIAEVPVAASYGLDQPLVKNVGDIETNGFEISLGYNHTGDEFNWSARANLGASTNKVTRLNDLDFIELNSFESTFISRNEVGEEINFFYGLETDGLFQVGDDTSAQPDASAGDVRFVDQNDDGVITLEDKVKIGSPTPDFTYGLNLSADYKGFDASLIFAGSHGNEIYNTNIYDLEGMTRLFNSGTAVLDRWTPTNTNTNVPRYTDDITATTQNVQASDRFIENGSFARLRNVTLGYSISSDALNSFVNGKLSKCRIYITGQNLLTITDYSGYDPEIGGSTVNPGSSRGTASIGVDRGNYPQPKSVIAGVQLTF